MKNQTNVADSIQDAKPLFSLTVSEFKSLHQKLLNEALSIKPNHLPSSPRALSQEAFVDDLGARRILSGNPEKPISKPTLNKLRKEGKINTYGAAGRRVLYSVAELNQMLAGTKKPAPSSKKPKTR